VAQFVEALHRVRIHVTLRCGGGVGFMGGFTDNILYMKMNVCTYVCMELIQIHISEPI